VFISLFPWYLWHVYNFTAFGAHYFNVYWKEQVFSRISSVVQGHAGQLDYYFKYWAHQLGIFFWLMAAGVLFLVLRLILARDRRDLMLAVWLLLTLAPIHIMKTKLYWYSLPALPPLLVLTGYIAEKLYSQSQKFVRVLFIIFIAVLFFNLFLWGLNVYNNLQTNSLSSVQNFSARIRLFVPEQEPLVVYRVGVWNFGRILPPFYWYLKFQNGLEPVLIDQQNLEHYAGRPEEYRYWITDNDGVEELRELVGINGILVNTQVGEYVLVTRKP
jgi:4-amino-4-deoxy-L-arabinose transferase-like glycosyltransferase